MAQPAPNYFIVIANPLKSAFAISPTCRPESSRMAPFWTLPRFSSFSWTEAIRCGKRKRREE